MKILIVSPAFYPQIGGIEEMAAILADQFAKQGHHVKVVCNVASSAPNLFRYEVIRRPGFWRYLKLVAWGDVFFQISISFKWLWPLLFIRRPWVVNHQSDYSRKNIQDWFKRQAANFAICVSNSKFVSSKTPNSEMVIWNAYRSDIFFEDPSAQRDKDLVFLGRLVKEKGCDVILQALAGLRGEGCDLNLTIVGDGPERFYLEQLAKKLRIEDRISFLGFKKNEDLRLILNQHKIMVIPSVYEEPFGIVALEGIACGCFVISSKSGGLPEAVGHCGIYFKPGDAVDLGGQIRKAMLGMDSINLAQRKAHLEQFQPEIIANSYLSVFEKTFYKCR